MKSPMKMETQSHVNVDQIDQVHVLDQCYQDRSFYHGSASRNLEDENRIAKDVEKDSPKHFVRVRRRRRNNYSFTYPHAPLFFVFLYLSMMQKQINQGFALWARNFTILFFFSFLVFNFLFFFYSFPFSPSTCFSFIRYIRHMI